jgi:hypothetical protein
VKCGEDAATSTTEETAMPPAAPPAILSWTRRLEEATALDGAVQTLDPHVRALFASGTRGAVLRGDWLGHALHPVLTDVVLGTWLSASVLDLTGRGRWSAPANTLVGTGLLAFGPTAWTGWAQWADASPRAKRVGVVHAVTNAAAVGTYAASWFARRSGRHESATRLALVGAAVCGAGGYLGGHLAEMVLGRGDVASAPRDSAT